MPCRCRWIASAATARRRITDGFLIFGGEYNTFDWLKIRRLEREEQARVTELQHTVDSLTKVAKALQKDRRVQERVARESFGMIRKGEHLYRLLPPQEGR